MNEYIYIYIYIYIYDIGITTITTAYPIITSMFKAALRGAAGGQIIQTDNTNNNDTS